MDFFRFEMGALSVLADVFDYPQIFYRQSLFQSDITIVSIISILK